MREKQLNIKNMTKLENLITEIYILTNSEKYHSSEDMQNALEDIRDAIETSGIFEIPKTLK